ncbi:PAS/PAC sensor hybrid histidine kinase [Jannaschia pohangensis]|uniref:histidine kinase n=2 Tax=Jannaschia pohangensis TaxID=390807 RepID=A0A1I3GZS7_9RHOB|nr:PAS/PAC sensor hybrid histidine kinase [Jannaschia pohangensis]
MMDEDAALLDALLDAAVDAIVVADAKGRILRVNAAAGTLFRQSLDRMLGGSISELMTPDMAARHPGFVETYLATGNRRIIGTGRDVTGRRGDGTTFPMHISVGRTDIAGGPVFIAIMHDLTRRLIAEEALMRAQRMDAIGQMTGGIAHDFNNLLTIIVGNLELMQMAGSDAKTAELIEDAMSAAEMGADLTSRLLLFSRKGELRPEPLDLGLATSDALRLLRRTLSARITVEKRLVDDIWPVELDPVQLQTAIINLALNAQDAMPDGGRLRLEVENITVDDDHMAQTVPFPPGRYVRLSVSDTGIGMTRDQQRRALEPFYTTKPPGKGTGLGLSMVYGYVGQSGGHLTLYSEVGKGTTVSLYFPRSDGGAARVPTQDTPSPAFGARRVVLVVEDDPAVRRLSEQRIAALGFDVVGADNAQDAWEILTARDDVALVFTDLVMPGTMTGEDLAHRIGSERPDVAVLLTSGFSGGMANLEGIEGAPQLLRKPYRQADLAAAVEAVLTRAP